MAGVALGDTHAALSSFTLSNSTLPHTSLRSFTYDPLKHNFVTHTTLSHATLSHTIHIHNFHTQLFHIQLFKTIDPPLPCDYWKKLTCGHVGPWGLSGPLLGIFTLRCAPRHKDVQFLICSPARWLRTRRFSELTFRPSGATTSKKTKGFAWFRMVSRLFYLFPHLDLLSLRLILSLLTSSLLHFCFSICLYCRKFDFKLPSAKECIPCICTACMRTWAQACMHAWLHGYIHGYIGA